MSTPTIPPMKSTMQHRDKLLRRTKIAAVACTAFLCRSESPCRQIASRFAVFAFSTKNTSSRDYSTSTTLPNSHKVFIGNLSPDACGKSSMVEIFSQFGTVKDVTFHGVLENTDPDQQKLCDESSKPQRSKVKPYAFVTFQDAMSASNAIAKWPSTDINQSMFSQCVVKPALERIPRPKSNARKVRSAERKQWIQQLSEQSNAVLQLPKSHMERMSNYITSISEECKCEVIGSLDPTTTATVGLLFISAEDPTMFAESLLSAPYVATHVNKLYIVEREIINASLSDTISAALGHATEEEISIRIQAFPPKILPETLSALESVLNEDEELREMSISPTKFTHTLSIIQLDDSTYVAGLNRALSIDGASTQDRSLLQDNSSEGSEDVVSRAYYKLQEAFTRYTYGSTDDGNSISPHILQRLKGSIGIDCGAAPGGWTKFLIEDIGCSEVYSVDPGALANSVENMHGVNHLRMRVDEAIPVLADKGVRVGVFVSDMCLHSISDQVGSLLQAKEKGILCDDAMFVLTIKCTIGYSSAAFDCQVQQEVVRLERIATGIQVIHLFANRSGERTIIGFLT